MKNSGCLPKSRQLCFVFSSVPILPSTCRLNLQARIFLSGARRLGFQSAALPRKQLGRRPQPQAHVSARVRGTEASLRPPFPEEKGRHRPNRHSHAPIPQSGRAPAATSDPAQSASRPETGALQLPGASTAETSGVAMLRLWV